MLNPSIKLAVAEHIDIFKMKLFKQALSSCRLNPMEDSEIEEYEFCFKVAAHYYRRNKENNELLQQAKNASQSSKQKIGAARDDLLNIFSTPQMP